MDASSHGDNIPFVKSKISLKRSKAGNYYQDITMIKALLNRIMEPKTWRIASKTDGRAIISDHIEIELSTDSYDSYIMLAWDGSDWVQGTYNPFDAPKETWLDLPMKLRGK